MKPTFHDPISAEIEDVGTAVVDAAVRVHMSLGPGLLENVYETCLCHELAQRQVPFRRQVGLPIVYNGIRLESGLRIDVLVSESVILELKTVDALTPLHEAQLLTYLKLSGKRLGFLLNFNVQLMKQGIKRMVL